MRYTKSRFSSFLFLGVFAVSIFGSANLMMRSNAYALDPCPEPRSALEKTPDNLAKVQEEIDRLTLCVERAQLLQRLNKLVEQNLDTIDSAILPDPEDLPPLPVADNNGMADLSGLSNPENQGFQPVGEATLGGTNGFNNNTPGIPSGMNNTPLPEPEDPVIVWKIRTIDGKSGALQARLVDDTGRLARARQGDVLHDKSRVIEVSKTRVRIKQEDEILDLEWHNDTAAEAP